MADCRAVKIAPAFVGTNDDGNSKVSSICDLDRYGRKLDEYRRFRHVVRNVYTYNFDPSNWENWSTQPPNFCANKSELLAFAAFLEQ